MSHFFASLQQVILKDDILDSIQEEPTMDEKLISERNKLLFFAAITLLIYVILFGIKYHKDFKILALFTRILTMTFLNIAKGFFIGIFMGMIPYKKLSFDHKYLRASLYTIIAINLLAIVLEVTLFEF